MVRNATKPRACVFCDIVARRAPAAIVYEGERFAAFMDIYPIRPGHVLVIPTHHAARLGDLGAGDATALFAVATEIAAAVRASDVPCDDLHLVLNDGAAANQTVPHCHVHVLPRTRGDTPTLFRKLFQRPVQPLLGAAARDDLERHAASIRAALAGGA